MPSGKRSRHHGESYPCIPHPPRVLLVNIENGSFAGRYVAAVMDGRRDIADILMENGVGRPYYGKGKRKPWCNESNESIRERHKRMTPRQDTAPRGYQVQSLLASLGTKDRVTKGSFPPVVSGNPEKRRA